MYCTVHSGCLLSPLYYPNMMHIKFLLPTALIKQPTRSQEVPNAICLPMQGKVKKFKKNCWSFEQPVAEVYQLRVVMQAYQPPFLLTVTLSLCPRKCRLPYK